MYAFKEHDLQGVDLKELPEGAYVITEYEPGEVVQATPPTPWTENPLISCFSLGELSVGC